MQYNLYCIKQQLCVADGVVIIFYNNPSEVGQLTIQSSNQFVMGLMGHHQSSPEHTTWNKTMEFGVFHMCLSVERIVVIYWLNPV